MRAKYIQRSQLIRRARSKPPFNSPKESHRLLRKPLHKPLRKRRPRPPLERHQLWHSAAHQPLGNHPHQHSDNPLSVNPPVAQRLVNLAAPRHLAHPHRLAPLGNRHLDRVQLSQRLARRRLDNQVAQVHLARRHQAVDLAHQHLVPPRRLVHLPLEADSVLRPPTPARHLEAPQPVVEGLLRLRPSLLDLDNLHLGNLALVHLQQVHRQEVLQRLRNQLLAEARSVPRHLANPRPRQQQHRLVALPLEHLREEVEVSARLRVLGRLGSERRLPRPIHSTLPLRALSVKHNHHQRVQTHSTRPVPVRRHRVPLDPHSANQHLGLANR